MERNSENVGSRSHLNFGGFLLPPIELFYVKDSVAVQCREVAGSEARQLLQAGKRLSIHSETQCVDFSD